MKNLKSIGICMSVLLLASCSYFNTEETIEVTSEGLESDTYGSDEFAVENVIYQKSKGSIEIYNLDLDGQSAENNFTPLDQPEPSQSKGLVMNPGVEIYPIDIPMQKTLKP